MESIKTMGIVLSTIDHKDKDKLASIFTLDGGIMTASFKGVKSLKSKNKLASSIFCFGEFLITKPQNIVTNVKIEDNFFDITKDIDKFYCGCGILQAIKMFLPAGESSPSVFVESLKAIGGICYGKCNEKYVFIKFLLSIFKTIGYSFVCKKCMSCQSENFDRKFMDCESGEIVCLACRLPYYVEIKPNVYSCLKILDGVEYERLGTVKIATQTVEDTINFLNIICYNRLGKKIVLL